MKHPTLTIEKTGTPKVTWGEYSTSTPEPGDHCNRESCVYRVTGPTGNIYKVQGIGYGGWMGRTDWGYERGSDLGYVGGFPTMARCLAAIDKREQAALTTQ